MIRVVFFILLIINILSEEYLGSGVAIASKSLLMPVLMYWVWREKGTFKSEVLILAALFFSWLGDLFLMVRLPEFFIYGLGAFLIAHLFYISVFIKDTEWKWIRILPLIAYLGLLLAGPLNGVLPAELKIPVYVYILVISIMGAMAAMRKSTISGYEPIVIGAVLFILSDSFIAINKFSSPVPNSGFWIMSTYGLAQFFIVKGYLKSNS